MKKEKIGRACCEVVAIIAAMTYVILRCINIFAGNKALEVFCILTSSIAVVAYLMNFAFFKKDTSTIGLVFLWTANVMLSVVLFCQWNSLKKKSIFFFLPQEGFLFLFLGTPSNVFGDTFQKQVPLSYLQTIHCSPRYLKEISNFHIF